MFTKLIQALKNTRRTIVFTEGPDARILEATDRLLKDDLMDVILVGNVDEVKAAAAKGGYNIEGVTILDPATYPEMDAMVEKMVELRKGKMSAEDCAKALSKGNYFGTMLVKMGKADALLGGATYSTADTVRPALQLVKTKPGAHLVSSAFIMKRDTGDEALRLICMGDCAINISYEDSVDKEGNVTVSAAQKLAEVAVESAKTAQFFGIDPKVAMLSFSTKGSGKGATVPLSAEATLRSTLPAAASGGTSPPAPHLHDSPRAAMTRQSFAATPRALAVAVCFMGNKFKENLPMGQRRPRAPLRARPTACPRKKPLVDEIDALSTKTDAKNHRCKPCKKAPMLPVGPRFAARGRTCRRAQSGRAKRAALHPAEKGLRGTDY